MMRIKAKAALLMCLAAAAVFPRPLVIVCRNDKSLSEWQQNLTELLPQAKIFELPEVDITPENDATVGQVKGRERLARRLDCQDIATPQEQRKRFAF